jgi:hypothetical protein
MITKTHLYPLLKIIGVLYMFLGHNFDVKKLNETGGLEFSNVKRTKLRMVLTVLVMFSFPFVLFFFIVLKGVG